MAYSHYFKSPLDMFNFVPESHEKAVKQAFYNTAAVLFVVFAFTAAFALYFVFKPFLEPLLWAVLFGSVLHPFKQTLTLLLHGWFKGLRDDKTPLAFGLVACPFKVIDNISENIGYFFLCNMKVFLGLCIGLPVVYLIYNVLPEISPVHLWNGIVICFQSASHTLEFFSKAGLLVWAVVIGYILLIFFWWMPQTQCAFPFISVAIWVMVISQFATVAGPVRVAVLFIFLVLLVIGFITEVKENWKQKKSKGTEDIEESDSSNVVTSTLKIASESLAGVIPPTEENEPSSMSDDTETSNKRKVQSETPNLDQVAQDFTEPPFFQTSTPKRNEGSKSMQKATSKRSNLCLYAVLWGCVLTQIWLNLWLLNLLPLPVIYIVGKKLGSHSGLFSFIRRKVAIGLEVGKKWYQTRKEVLVPTPIRGLGKILVQGDQKVLAVLEGSIDTFTSIGVMLLVLILAVVGTVLLSVQIYGESVHLVEVTSNLVNRVVVHNPELQQLLPEKLQDVQGTLDSVVGNAYVYGREWITTTVKEFINEKDESRANIVEEQILKVWDRIYHMWKTKNSTIALTSQHGVSWNELVDGMKTLNLTLLISYIQQNIGTLISVLESVWTVIINNFSLALSSLTAIFSLLFGGGTALLNFLLDFVVFSTALFYLLCASSTCYKPVELVSKLLPSGGAGNKVGEVVEQSINGVFAASFKLALFYGLYTWLIHTLFDVNIIYIPSVLAAIFGAVPFLGAYWACLPAVLELWLVNGQPFRACLMFIGQLAPSSFVDSAIYSEIKGGGHPYLTGLAIAGGVFCLGFRGALFGPMLLCLLMVAINMYSSVMQGTSGAELGQGIFKRTSSQ
ncbi:transmembrane protein 245-like isoform X2 [Tachypleus tridentatus]|uniref:transmembrane protein 245-like isoform X2 n=1 Tax=Tachypleus tridentatus TaxID=6853 RepID=UPI003FD0E966